MDAIAGIIAIVIACLVVLATGALTYADYRLGHQVEVEEALECFSVLVLYGILAWVVSVSIASLIYAHFAQ